MSGFLARIRNMIEGDRSVRLVAEDPALTSELLLLFKVILADGEVRPSEIDAFKRICAEAFGLDTDNMQGVYKYLEDYAYETTTAQAAEMFNTLPHERRQMLLDHMIAIAEADSELNVKELRLLEKTADRLGFDLGLHTPSPGVSQT